MVRNPLEKKWEFETNEGWLADTFLQVLEMFHVPTQDIYIPSFLDMSQVEFRTTKKKRLQIEYVFRRLVNKHWYYSKIYRASYSAMELEGGDWYAIY